MSCAVSAIEFLKIENLQQIAPVDRHEQRLGEVSAQFVLYGIRLVFELEYSLLNDFNLFLIALAKCFENVGDL